MYYFAYKSEKFGRMASIESNKVTFSISKSNLIKVFFSFKVIYAEAEVRSY